MPHVLQAKVNKQKNKKHLKQEWHNSDKTKGKNLPIHKEASRREIVLQNVNCQSIHDADELDEKSLAHIRITPWQTEMVAMEI